MPVPPGQGAQEALLALPKALLKVLRGQGVQARLPRPLAKVPGLQSAQATAWGKMLALPGAQGAQAAREVVPPGPVPYLPPGQAPLQLDCPGEALKSPGAQGMQAAAEAAPRASPAVPAGQGEHCGEPGALANDPTLQGVQAEASDTPREGWLVPGGQEVQALAALREVPLPQRPAGQGAEVPPRQNDPWEQGPHPPPLRDSLPGAHEEQFAGEVEPGGEKRPAGQAWHAAALIAPRVELNLLLSQRMHCWRSVWPEFGL